MKQTRVLKGFRDLEPQEAAIKWEMITRIRRVFSRFGFLPLETPGLEYADVLLGKYGAEAEKLFYIFQDHGGRRVGLPYDLTVPVSRFLAGNPQLKMPFKRYQIQNVFRAEKPQRGRYREFTQCDIDTFGSVSPLADAEILLALVAALKELGLAHLVLKINSRQILDQALEKAGIVLEKQRLAILRIIDKKEKISPAVLQRELARIGLEKKSQRSLEDVFATLQPDGNLKQIIQLAEGNIPSGVKLEFDPYLARGLDYYTKMIFEINIPGVQLGSVAGGGRYDKLISQLGGRQTPAVGGSLGLDRLLVFIQEKDMWSKITPEPLVLVAFFPETSAKALRLAQTLRQKNIPTEIYLGKQTKLKAQINYAVTRNIRYLAILGSEEVKTQSIILKNLQKREQKKYSLTNLVGFLQQQLKKDAGEVQPDLK